jgi:TRAP-type C4-dicarboxylate transport system permease small subunit
VERIANLYCKGLNVLTAIALLLMVVLVFGNVVLRYAFNSSVIVSEELSRWLFVWITFLGAVIALREHSHLGTDALVSRLSPRGKKICLVVGHFTMLYVCWLVFKGSLEQTRINADVLAPSTQWPMSIVYAAGIVFAVSATGMLLLDLWLMATGRLGNEQLVMVQESEDLAALKSHVGAHHVSPPPRTP